MSEMVNFTSTRHLNYYQWIVFILVFKVFLFRLPSYVWSFFISLNGFDLVHVNKVIMNKIYQDEYMESKNWMKTQGAIEAIGEHLRLSFLKQKFQTHKRFRGFFAGKKLGLLTDSSKITSDDKARFRQNYPNLRTKTSFPLFEPYILVKLIYLANIAFNFVFLSAVFGFDYITYGPEFIKLLITNKYEFANEYFPKRSACFYQIMNKLRDNNNMVICSLPVNLINEYFYAAYWYFSIYIVSWSVII